jgi:hypothetical protein
MPEPFDLITMGRIGVGAGLGARCTACVHMAPSLSSGPPACAQRGWMPPSTLMTWFVT